MTQLGAWVASCALVFASIAAFQDAAPSSDARTATRPADGRWSRWCERRCEIERASDGFDGEELSKASERLESIEKELASIGDHPWAGVYACGDGMDFNVRIHVAPRGGFVFASYGCLGLYGFNHGDVAEVAPGHLRGVLSRRLASDSSPLTPLPGMGGWGGDAYVDGEFYVFAWRGHRYLVPGKEMIPLCNAVNAGSDGAFAPGPNPLFPRFELRASLAASAPAEALPPVPGEFAPHLLARPVQARVLSDVVTPRTLENRDAGTKATIYEHVVRLDAGADKAIRRGMHFHRRGASSFDGLVLLAVEDVGPTDCVVRGREAPLPYETPSGPLAVGTEFSTRRRDLR
ncbi:MAG TPA: hypothetical protein VKE69_02985 [Planctomycetota bacterium]|nr:hypothetical protein [Planctomycetota bacterium]